MPICESVGLLSESRYYAREVRWRRTARNVRNWTRIFWFVGVNWTKAFLSQQAKAVSGLFNIALSIFMAVINCVCYVLALAIASIFPRPSNLKSEASTLHMRERRRAEASGEDYFIST